MSAPSVTRPEISEPITLYVGDRRVLQLRGDSLAIGSANVAGVAESIEALIRLQVALQDLKEAL